MMIDGDNDSDGGIDYDDGSSKSRSSSCSLQKWCYIVSCVMAIVASRLSYSLIDADISGGLAVSATFLINVLLFVIFFGQVDRVMMMSMMMMMIE